MSTSPHKNSVLAVLLVVVAGCDPATEPALSHEYPDQISCATELTSATPVALPRNIIFLMGDGMGPVQVHAGALKRGAPLRFEGLSEPIYFNTDSITTDMSAVGEPTDSAAAATAFATGTRVVNGVLAVADDGAVLETVLEHAKRAGKATGLVTNSFIYDASPMAFAVHASSRELHTEIITDLFTNARPDVILGGGRPIFLDNDAALMNLATEAGYAIVEDAAELRSWDSTAAPSVLGLFEASVVSSTPTLWEWFTTPVSMRSDASTDPLLTDMVSRALERLSTDDDGFFLFIEDEHIDTFGHIALVERELAPIGVPDEVNQVDAVYALLRQWIDDHSSFEETLLVVTADHESGGYTLYGDDLSEAAFWGSPEHTRQPVALYAAGPGTDNVSAICRVSDINLLLTGRLPAVR